MLSGMSTLRRSVTPVPMTGGVVRLQWNLRRGRRDVDGQLQSNVMDSTVVALPAHLDACDRRLGHEDFGDDGRRLARTVLDR